MSIFISIPKKMCQNFNIIAAVALLILSACSETSVDKTDESKLSDQYDKSASVTKGRATQNVSSIFECDVPGWRVTAAATISGEDNKAWTVPADTAFNSAPKATDLFNECNNILMADETELDVNSVPIVELDQDGDVITAYFFGDNYYEFFVNGKIIAVDPVPYWPFNTSAVRFKVKRPFIAGVKMIDWSENLGLGSETMRGVPFHTGDGGFVGVFKDSDGRTIALTDKTWRVQPFYIAPLQNASCVEPDRTSGNCVVPAKSDAENAYGVHWEIPSDWSDISYNDAHWQNATLYTNEDIGGSIQRPAYENFTGLFDDPQNDAQFILSLIHI